MRRYLQITGPKTPTRMVRCDRIEQCLEVLSVEAESQPPGVVFNLLEIRGETPRPIGRWTINRNRRLKRAGHA